MAKYLWCPRLRNYEQEHKRFLLHRQTTVDHPLKANVISSLSPKSSNILSSNPTSRSGTPRSATPADPLTIDRLGRNDDDADMIDPLSVLAIDDDPLALSESQPVNLDMSVTKGSGGIENFEPWSVKRAAILSKYTTSEKLTIASSFFGEESAESDNLVVKEQAPATVSEKVRHRLEQLDDFEDGSVQEMQNLTQKEFISHVEKLKSSMEDFWNQDQKVKALKITIQCAKMLADTSVIRFYPSKFVLISDILDSFGCLVYERIFARSNQVMGAGSNKTISKLPPDFTFDLIPNSAKEVCRNWFHKIASIRELIPRILCEAAIVRCLNFISPKEEIVKCLSKLASLTRGIGDPLASVYAKSYLCRVGMDTAFTMPNFLTSKDEADMDASLCTINHLPHVQTCFRDFLLSYRQLSAPCVESLLKAQRVEVSAYRSLYTPALDWIIQCLSFNASESDLSEIMDAVSTCTPIPSALVLNSILSSFPPDYIVKRSVVVSSLIKEADDALFHKPTLYKTFGICLTLSDPVDKKTILNEAWKSITKIENSGDYIACVEVWIEFVAKHFTTRELSFVLNDVIFHLTPDRAFESFYGELLSCLSKILVHTKSVEDMGHLFSTEKFLPYMDLLQKEHVKVEASKMIVENFLRLQGSNLTTDPIIISTVMSLSRNLHDSLTPLSLEDECNHISHLIKNFISIVSFGRDFEAQLSFYVQARSAFTNLQSVTQQLVHSVNALAMSTLKVVKGVHSKRTSAFVHACVAYNFITIPSLDSQLFQLGLYLESAQVALSNHCYGQADALFKAAIILLPTVPTEITLPDSSKRSTEGFLLEYLKNFLSTLLLVPDNPEQGTILYLLSGCMNAVKACEQVNPDLKATFDVNVIGLLSSFAQETYAYHCKGIDANDVMYGSAPKFLEYLNKMVSTLVEEVLEHMRNLQTQIQNGGHRRIHRIAVALFSQMVSHADLNDESMIALAANLWSLALKTAGSETDYNFHSRKKLYFQSLKNKGYSNVLEQLPMN